MSLFEFFDNESKWCKRYYAVNNEGSVVSCDNESAVKFCLSGAIHRLYPPNSQTDIYEKLYKAAEKLNLGNQFSAIPVLNDSICFATLKNWLKEADV